MCLRSNNPDRDKFEKAAKTRGITVEVMVAQAILEIVKEHAGFLLLGIQQAPPQLPDGRYY